jgi:hypothetical protein
MYSPLKRGEVLREVLREVLPPTPREGLGRTGKD